MHERVSDMESWQVRQLRTDTRELRGWVEDLTGDLRDSDLEAAAQSLWQVERWAASLRTQLAVARQASREEGTR